MRRQQSDSPPRNQASVRDILPVRIAKSDLAADIPDADLYITQWHSLLGLMSGRKGPYSRFRSASALSPWIDCRQQVDIIRDRVEERGIALLQQTEIMAHCFGAGCYTEAVTRARKAIERFPRTSADLFFYLPRRRWPPCWGCVK